MGKNKGKGATNLRRMNQAKKLKREYEDILLKFEKKSMPGIYCDPHPSYISISEKIQEIK